MMEVLSLLGKVSGRGPWVEYRQVLRVESLSE